MDSFLPIDAPQGILIVFSKAFAICYDLRINCRLLSDGYGGADPARHQTGRRATPIAANP